MECGIMISAETDIVTNRRGFLFAPVAACQFNTFGAKVPVFTLSQRGSPACYSSVSATKSSVEAGIFSFIPQKGSKVMSWDQRYTEEESGINFVLSHSHLFGRESIRSVGFILNDELAEAIKARSPKIFEVLEAVSQYHELVFFVKDLEGGYFFEEAIGEVGGSEFRAKLEAALACDSPLLTSRDREVARQGLAYIDNRVRLFQEAEAEKSHTSKRRKEFNRKRDNLIKIVIERDGYQCTKCGSTEDLTLDHKTPLSKGGSDDPENLQILCRSHNSQKGTRIVAIGPEEG
jgi:5-methylcytosine-specific restriction endonuclease McrA